MSDFLFRSTGWFRTDVRYMRRSDLFRSSREFLIAGLVGCALMAVLGWVAFRDSKADPSVLVLAVVTFGLPILSGMGLLGSVYLLVRGCLRSPTYDAQRVWEEDMAELDHDL